MNTSHRPYGTPSSSPKPLNMSMRPITASWLLYFGKRQSLLLVVVLSLLLVSSVTGVSAFAFVMHPTKSGSTLYLIDQRKIATTVTQQVTKPPPRIRLLGQSSGWYICRHAPSLVLPLLLYRSSSSSSSHILDDDNDNSRATNDTSLYRMNRTSSSTTDYVTSSTASKSSVVPSPRTVVDSHTYTTTTTTTNDNQNSTTTTTTTTNDNQNSTITTTTDQIRLPPSVTSSLGDIMSVATLTTTSPVATSRPVAFETNSTTVHRNGMQEETTATIQKQSLQERYQIYHPLDRMILTANGNVQRLISSYYDTKYYAVEVHVIYCQLRPPTPSPPHLLTTANKNVTATVTASSNDDSENNGSTILPQIWDRKVELCLYTTNTDAIHHSHDTSTATKHVFCTATSVITIHDVQCQKLIELQQIGIGQLFRYYNILPNFTLHDAGPLHSHPNHPNSADDPYNNNNNNSNNVNSAAHDGGGNFWREYTLSCPQLSCWIREEFPPGLWNISLHPQ